MEAILRAFAAPLGYWIGSLLSPVMGNASFLLGTTLVNSLVECLIAMLQKLGAWDLFQYFRSAKHAKIIITDHYRVSQVSCLILETYPEIVLEYQDSGQAQILVKSVRPGSQLQICGVTCQIQVSAGESSSQEENGQAQVNRIITITYPNDQITASEIASAIVSYQPRQTYLRIYHPTINKEGECTWHQMTDFSKANASNTFFTEQVQEQFVDDVTGFISSFVLGTSADLKRTYLLHGQSGAGKTSSIRAVLGSHKIFSVPNQLLRNEKRFEAMMTSITKYLSVGEIHTIVLDEVDKCHWGYRMLGPLCSFLDGIMPNAGRIVVMTANEISYFTNNPVLVRPGRINKVIEMTYPDDRQLRRTIAQERPDWSLPEEPLCCEIAIAEVIEKLRAPNATLEQIVQASANPIVVEPEPCESQGGLEAPPLPIPILLERLQILEERYQTAIREEILRNRILVHNEDQDDRWVSNRCFGHGNEDYLTSKICAAKYCVVCCRLKLERMLYQTSRVRDDLDVIAYLTQESSAIVDCEFQDLPEPLLAK